MGRVSVIIPSRNEGMYLDKTLNSVLENATGDVEVIAVLDGWEYDSGIDDGRVVWVRHKEATGQRPSINEAARIASGDYIMKLDAHCAVGYGFDEILARDCDYDMTMVPAMFNLDVTTWKPKYFDDWQYATKKGKLNPYMYIGWKGGHLRAQYYGGKMRRDMYEAGKSKCIDETMCLMGPCFFMHKDRFWELDGCDEGHGQWGQQGVEVACKAWLSGGRLVTNKNTWFAHFFRGGGVPEGHNRGFPYPISQHQINAARDYSDDLWINNRWEKQTKTFQWLVEKFKPPGWDEIPNPKNRLGISQKRLDLFIPLYRHIHGRRHDSSWKGVQLLKFPTDMVLYQEAIYETKPDVIVEIGTKFGASAVFFKDMLDMLSNGGDVITIDVKDQVKARDTRITYLIGDSKDKKIIQEVKARAKNKKTMLVIDGDHRRVAVKWDLHNYSTIVTPGQYMVVEDCFAKDRVWGPGEALEWFLRHSSKFTQTQHCEKYLIGMTMGGWLKRNGA